MSSPKRRGARRIKNAVACVLATLAIAAAPAAATHFNGASISWYRDLTYTVPNMVRIVVTYDSTWRWSYSAFSPTFPGVGQTFSGIGVLSYSSLPSGTTQSVSLSPTVLYVDTAEDRFYARAVVTLDLPASGFPYSIEQTSGNRLSALEEGNHDLSWKQQTLINLPSGPSFGFPFRSAALTVPYPQRIHLPVNTPASILLPIKTHDNMIDVVRFAPATSSLLTQTRPMSLASGYCPYLTGCTDCNTSFTGPCSDGMTITGQRLNWTPTRTSAQFPTAGLGLYAVQLTFDTVDLNNISRATAPFDIVFQVENQCPNGSPCRTPATVSVAVQPTYSVAVGATLSVPIIASSSDTTVNLLNTFLPGNATLTALTGSAPLNSTLSYTPLPSEVGSHNVCFQAITNGGDLSSIQCTDIIVTAAANTPTITPSQTSTSTATQTPTTTATETPTQTPTETLVAVATQTPTGTATNTATNTATFTPTNTATITPTDTATVTPTQSATLPSPTATTATGFVPPDAATEKCSKSVAGLRSKLFACTTKCKTKYAAAALDGKSFDLAACEQAAEKSCRTSFDGKNNKLLAKVPALCPSCRNASAQDELADGVSAFLASNNGLIYCAGTTSFGGGNSGFVPPDANTLKCASSVIANLKKLSSCVDKCEIKRASAAFKAKSFDTTACKQAGCRADYDAKAAKLLAQIPALCPPCLDASAQSHVADLVVGFSETSNAEVYCAGTMLLP